MDSAFYVLQGDRFVSSELTRGPWDPDSQHAGPPAALIARELERRRELAVRPDHLRDPEAGADRAADGEHGSRAAGAKRRAARCDARGRGRRAVIRATAWRVVRTAVELPSASPARTPAVRLGRARRWRRRPTVHRRASSKPGRTTATTRRWSIDFSPGAFSSRGRRPCGCGCEQRWSPASSRVRCSVCSPRPIRATASAPTLDWSRFLFINVDLSVHLHRMPATEWVCLDAITVPEPTGIGLADTALHDEGARSAGRCRRSVVRAR